MLRRNMMLAIAMIAGLALVSSDSRGQQQVWIYSYGAIAVAYTLTDGKRVSTGAVAWNHQRQDAADAAAVNECRRLFGQGCSVAYRFANGECGYLSTAVSGGNCAGVASSPGDAYRQCQARGCLCSWGTGGCAAKPLRLPL